MSQHPCTSLYSLVSALVADTHVSVPYILCDTAWFGRSAVQPFGRLAVWRVEADLRDQRSALIV